MRETASTLALLSLPIRRRKLEAVFSGGGQFSILGVSGRRSLALADELAHFGGDFEGAVAGLPGECRQLIALPLSEVAQIALMISESIRGVVKPTTIVAFQALLTVGSRWRIL